MGLFEKKYSIFSLYVIGMNRGNSTYQYFICEDKNNEFIEIFTKMKLKKDKISFHKPLSRCYPIAYFASFTNNNKSIPKVDLKDLLHKYNEINYLNTLLENDEDIVEEVLTKRGIFEDSRTYERKLERKNTNG